MYSEDDLQPYDLLPRFTNVKCPECGQKFVQIWRFGLFCTFRNCGWSQEAPNKSLEPTNKKLGDSV